MLGTPTVPKFLNTKSTVSSVNCSESLRVPKQLVQNDKSRTTWPHENSCQDVMLNSCLVSMSVPKQQVPSNAQSAVSFHYKLTTPKACDWTLIFETYPVWIFSLTPFVTKRIFLPQFKNWNELCTHILKYPS